MESTKRHIIAKISGDLQENAGALQFLRKLGDYQPLDALILVIVGGRTQINEALIAGGYELQFHGNGRRKYPDLRANSIGSNVLMDLEKKLSSKLWAWSQEDGKTHTKNYQVIPPFWQVGYMAAHIDADDMLRMMYHNFDEAYCLTKKGRVKDFPEAIKVVGFE